MRNRSETSEKEERYVHRCKIGGRLERDRGKANTFLGLGSDLEFGGPEDESGGGVHDTLEEIGCCLLVISTSCTPPPEEEGGVVRNLINNHSRCTKNTCAVTQYTSKLCTSFHQSLFIAWWKHKVVDGAIKSGTEKTILYGCHYGSS